MENCSDFCPNLSNATILQPLIVFDHLNRCTTRQSGCVKNLTHRSVKVRFFVYIDKQAIGFDLHSSFDSLTENRSFQIVETGKNTESRQPMSCELLEGCSISVVPHNLFPLLTLF